VSKRVPIDWLYMQMVSTIHTHHSNPTFSPEMNTLTTLHNPNQWLTGVFGDFIQDNVRIIANQTTNMYGLVWIAESAGRELWRIGVSDKSSGESWQWQISSGSDSDSSFFKGEFRNGYERDESHPNHPESM